MNSALTTARMIFPRLSSSFESPYQLIQVFDADMHGLPFKRVAKANQNGHVCGFIRERGRGLVPLRYVEVRFEIIEDGVGVSSRLLFWQGVSRSLGLELPFLDDSIARLLKPYRPFCCFKERLLFSHCLRCHVCHSENI